MSELSINQIMPTCEPDIPDYTLISPRQFYNRINRDLDEPIGITTVYRLIKEKDFPSVKIGGRFFVIEEKVSEWLQCMSGNRKK